MKKDQHRVDRLAFALKSEGLDALVCTLPSNVLLLTGYWPIVGSAIAVVTKDGEVALLAPADERELWQDAGADHFLTLSAGPLGDPGTIAEPVQNAFRQVCSLLHLSNGSVGIETGPASEQASYVAMTLYLDGILELLKDASPFFIHRPADELLWRERGVLTEREIAQVKLACGIARQAYHSGAQSLREWITEIEASQYFQVPLSTFALAVETVRRADGRVSCMSGVNAGNAYGAYARPTKKVIQRGELILTHCNSQADGYFTDITRTYYIGEPQEKVGRMYEALLAASQAGIAAVKPGIRAAQIDRAVRSVLEENGFGLAFKHGTGHGVGFAAIDHRARPRVGPDSNDILEEGMIFNIEPGIYFEDFGGMRQCEMVVVTASGAELLTPFHNELHQLLLA